MKPRAVFEFVFLVALGSLRMGAQLFDAPRLDAVGAMLQVAPAMKVFTAHQGYETHVARFALAWLDADGVEQVIELTPSTYARVRGPYNRRNVYGAALAYGPILRSDPRTHAMQASVMRHAFCSRDGLRRELRVPADVSSLQVRVIPSRADARRDLARGWSVDCHG
jgi:hypothetical protein